MNKIQILGQLYEEYNNHMEDMKQCVEELSGSGSYDSNQQKFQEGYFAAYEEILQDLEIKMKDN